MRPAQVTLASTPEPIGAHVLFGCNSTTGIVSVDADAFGRARVWRRDGDNVEVTEHQFPNWFLTTSLDLLSHLSSADRGADWLRASHGQVSVNEPLTIVQLDATGIPPDEDAYRYLVLTTRLHEVETALIETVNKRDGGEAQTLEDLRGLVLVWPPIEQFLMLTGRTYFKAMPFDGQRRFQFDLETTGLNEERDRIFMISMRDSTGWRACLDTGTLTETELLERFVELVRARDPDTLENHNIFGFDLPFLVKRAGRLGIRMALGRDGSEPWLETDVFDSGERPEPFVRWRVAGREVIDTQHAVRRYALEAPDLRRHGLKDAAKYFGFARSDREYVPGAEIWTTFGTDPDRIRRYAEDDVDEVDGLARQLLPATFALASLLPRAYERVAADSGPAALWELLMVRAYLHEGRAIGAPMPQQQRPNLESRSEVFIRGVTGKSVRAALQPLLPCVVADRSITAANDALGLMPRLLEAVMDRTDAGSLAAAAHPYLAGTGLFSDPNAADDATTFARQYVDRLLEDLRGRGCTAVSTDGEQVLFGVPAEWNQVMELQVADAARSYLPPGVHLTFLGHYEALYARGPGTAITLAADRSVTLVGPAFRAGRLERFGETFIQRAASQVLSGDIVGVRQTFLETVHLLRTGQIPLEELSVQVTLHKSPQQYRRGGTREEPYEVLLAAGVRAWRVGQRIRYFRARGGEARLLQEGAALSAIEADLEYYVQRLYGLYCQHFAQAFNRDDFNAIFRLPSGPGPFVDSPDTVLTLSSIRPIAESVR